MLLLVLDHLLKSSLKAFLPDGIKSLLEVHQELLESPFQPGRTTQLHLVGLYQLQHVGTGFYSLLNDILLRDVLDWRHAPICIPLTLLRF